MSFLMGQDFWSHRSQGAVLGNVFGRVFETFLTHQLFGLSYPGRVGLTIDARDTITLLSNTFELEQQQVMAISVISVSSDSSEDSVGTPVGPVILFRTIPTTIRDTTPVITSPTAQTDTTVIPTEIPIIAPTIPPSPDYTLASPDYSPASDTEFDPSEDPSLDHIPPLLAISPFLSSADDTTYSDTPDTPPLPTHGTPFTKTTLSTQRSPTASGALRRRVMVLAPGQPIPYGRPYCYHLNGPVHMMTARNRVGPLPTHRQRLLQILLRMLYLILHLVVHLLIIHCQHHHWRSRSPVASVPLSSPTLGALSYARADLLPSPERIRNPETATDLENCSEDRFEPYVPREVGLGVDFEKESSKPSRSRGADLVMDVDVVRNDMIEIDPKIQEEIDECFAYADALRDRGIDARVVVEFVDREESEMGTRGPVEVKVKRVTHPRFHDHTEAIPVHHIQAIEGVQREQGRRIVGAESAFTVLTERVAELGRDNRRLRGTASVESQRVDRLQRGMAHMQRELRQIRWKMPDIRSGASRTREVVNEQSDLRMAEALRVRDTVRNLRPLMGDEVEQEEVGGNGNG
ncbi:hypothetical protein Tco_0715514 [Tanacetum coccineum]